MSSCGNCGIELPADALQCPNCTTQIQPAQRGALPEISGYQILGRLGEGGMGAIYLAEEKSLGRRVAIKVITAKIGGEEQARARFAREARALATIEHANVVRVYSFGEVDGQPYLAMEYVDGETLAERIRRLGRLPVEEAVRFTREILVGLDAAWEKGIVHRDIKPSNVLIDRRGNVHVADFGLAKARQVADDMILTQSGHVLGTPYYVAPEQAQGKATDFRADIYSTGILLFEMLAGERPFEGTTPFTVVAKHISEPLPSIRAKRAEVANRVARVLERMTQKQPEERPQSYAELIGVFDALLGITPKSIPRTETFSSMPLAKKTGYRLPTIISAMVILATIGWQSYLVKKRSPPSRNSVADQQMVVAVTPFYGPDDDSAKEGRVMGALIERSITGRLGAKNVHVVGIDETKQPVRSHDAARQLGERVHATVVVWGEAFALKRETEIQPYFTLLRPSTPREPGEPAENVRSIDVTAADAVSKLSERSASVVRVEAEAPNQIELRKTSAEGVGEMVSLLAAIHALYDENDARKALTFFAQAPKTAEALRHRSQALAELDNVPEAIKSLEDALSLDPKHVQSRAQLADLYLRAGRFRDAAQAYLGVATSGQPYTTTRAIAYRGNLYVRLMYHDTDSYAKESDTGTLLEMSPQTEIVSRRWQLPGGMRSFEPRPDGFLIRYAADANEHMIETLTFRGSDFERLPPPGGNLLLRMRAMKPGWVLPRNFTTEFSGSITDQAAYPAYRLTKKPSPGAPRTLPDLEAALRDAARRDPTQPWHIFYLGQTLWAEDRHREAELAWTSLLQREWPGILYPNFVFMARIFERLGQRDWADRAYDRALRERRRMVQPIVFATLIERLINAPVARLHPEQLKDPQRAYVWLQRAKALSGPTEADNYAAAAWAGYFRRHGDRVRARVEEENASALALYPFNFTSRATEIDYAMYALFATWFGLIASLTLVFWRTGRGRADAGANLRAALESLKSAIPRRWLPFAAGGAVGAVVIIGAGILAGTWWAPASMTMLIAIVLIFAAHASGVGRQIAGTYQRVTTQARFTLMVLLLLFIVSAAATRSVINAQASLRSMPIGIADSLGNPVLVADLESRLAKTPTAEVRYVTAVANQLGRNFERARELYQQLPGDPRSQRAIVALQRGRSEMTMPSIDELYRAYSATSSNLFSEFLHADGPTALVMAIIAMTAVLAVAMLLPCLFIRPTEQAQPHVPRTKFARIAAKIGFLLVPGSFDLLRRSVARGAATMTLLGFGLFLAASMKKAFPIVGSPGLRTAMSLPNMKVGWPLPPDTSPLDLMLAPAHALTFWIIAVAGVVTLCVFHAIRIPAILAVGREGPAAEAPRLVPAEEPA